MTYEQSDWDATYLERWTPGGSQTGSKAPGKAGPRGSYPAVLDQGYDAHVWDVDGNRYIDWIAGLAAVGLGHAHRDVTAAVSRRLTQGSLLSLPTRLEGEATEALCGFMGWPEQVRWVKTGSEACEAAVRIARCATGRDIVITVRAGYHGWHSWFQAVKPEHPGVPDLQEQLIWAIPYGDYDGCAALLSLEKAACVILEAAPITGDGDRAWLRWLAETARAHGTLLIFDEVVWGLRLARAGGQQFFGVTPDLATYGKALGNGVPVACVAGGRDLMKHAGVVSGTYGGDGLGLAAAVAVMEVYQEENVIGHLWEMGSMLVDGLQMIGVDVSGYPVHPIVKCKDADSMSLLLQGLADNGVLWHPGGVNVMHAHTSAHVLATVKAFGLAMSVVRAAEAEGDVRRRLRGEPYAQAFARRT